MTREQLDKAVETLLVQLDKRPEDIEAIHAQLAQKIDDYHNLGLPVPDALANLEAELDQDDEDEWDNLPV